MSSAVNTAGTEATQAVPGVPMPHVQRHGLLLSDLLFLFGLALAMFYVTDPFGWRFERILLTKHLPLFFAVSGAALVMMGAALFQLYASPAKPFRYGVTGLKPRHALEDWPVLHASWPLALLGLWIMTGSLTARNFGGIHNTFLGMGLHMLFALLAARVVLDSNARERIVTGYLMLATLAAVAMIVGMVFGISASAGAYHEMEGLVIPLAVYYALRPMPNAFSRYALVALFLGAGLVLQKYTGYLVVAITLFYLWLADWHWRLRASVTWRRRAIVFLFLTLLAGLLVAAWLSARNVPVLPTGNPQYRLTTYQMTWQLFRESPVWGTLFTSSATEKFTGFDIAAARGVLPSHSDLLDIAAHGGMLALGLWLWAHLRVGRLVWRTVIRPRKDMPARRGPGMRHHVDPDAHDALSAAGHALSCMVLTSILVYTFNPIMLQPVKALLLWSQFGMLLGIALYLERKATGSDRPDAKLHDGAAPAENRDGPGCRP